MRFLVLTLFVLLSLSDGVFAFSEKVQRFIDRLYKQRQERSIEDIKSPDDLWDNEEVAIKNGKKILVFHDWLWDRKVSEKVNKEGFFYKARGIYMKKLEYVEVPIGTAYKGAVYSDYSTRFGGLYEIADFVLEVIFVTDIERPTRDRTLKTIRVVRKISIEGLKRGDYREFQGLIPELNRESVVNKWTRLASEIEFINYPPTPGCDKYRTCRDLWRFHPAGVPEGHCAYRKRLDKNKDGWACGKL